MENGKKILTDTPLKGKIEGSKELFLRLLKEKNKQGLSDGLICRKTKIATSSFSRYINAYESQSKATPKLDYIIRFADALGYEIHVVEKNIESSNNDEQGS